MHFIHAKHFKIKVTRQVKVRSNPFGQKSISAMKLKDRIKVLIFCHMLASRSQATPKLLQKHFKNPQIYFKPPPNAKAHINPSPFSVFRHLRQWRGVGATHPAVSKSSVVELSGKNSGLLSTSTRDWWYVFCS